MGKHSAPPRHTFLLRTREFAADLIPPLPIVLAAATGVAMSGILYHVAFKPLDRMQTTTMDPYIRKCGEVLCQGSHIFAPNIKAVCRSALENPQAIVDEAVHDSHNVIEIGSVAELGRTNGDPKSKDTWEKIDGTIAEAQKENIRIILNLSRTAFRGSTTPEHEPSINQWRDFIEFAGTRTNTKTHIAYRNDPTIMAIDLYPSNECSQNVAAMDPTTDPRIIDLTQNIFPRHVIYPADVAD